jgi:hypothetical protein
MLIGQAVKREGAHARRQEGRERTERRRLQAQEQVE